MIQGKTVLAIVPARGGSKGIKLKNLACFNGKPLIVWAAEILKQLPCIDRRIVSTDHDEIAHLAVAHGLDCPFMRPWELSGDFVSDVDVLIHALNFMESHDAVMYDIVIMLQPTSPMRTTGHVKRTIEKLIAENCDSVLTVSKTNLKYHPLKQLIIENDRVNYFDENGRDIIARQQLSPTFHRNGVAYAIKRECLLEQRAVIGTDACAIIISEKVINIDTPDDLLDSS